MMIKTFLIILLLNFTLQQLGRPYNNMEESLQCNLRLQQQLIESFEESSLNYLPNHRKRGKLPHKQKQPFQISQKSYINISQAVIVGQYPYTAVGVIRWYLPDAVTVGIGAIIGKNLVITSTAMIDKAMLKQYKIGFTPLNKKEEIFCIKKHPYEVYKWSYLNRPTQEDASEIECLILQFDSTTNLQIDSGRLGINFKWDYFCWKPLLMSIQQRQNGIFLNILPIHQEFIQQQKEYHLHEDDEALIGSLVLDACNNQFDLRGFHIYQRQNVGEFLKLTQAQYKRFKNMTYKILELDLSHEPVKLKNLSYFSKIDKKKIKIINLTCSSVGSQSLKIFSKVDCELIIMQLGHNSINDDSIKQLTNTSWILEQLKLNNNLITANSLQTIKECNWRDICKLTLDENNLGAKGMKYLSSCNWRMLENLSLCKTQLDACAILHLSKGHWPFLTELILDRNRIGNEGVKFLISGYWRRLTFLGLYNNHIKLEGLKRLMSSVWPILRKIRICKQNVLQKKMKLENIGITLK